MSLTADDLFGGAGGASCGLREAGYDVTAFEKWDIAADTHDANHERPVVRCDLETFDWAEWPTPDLLWGSPPCQPWSSAGKRLGAEDERDGMPWFLRAVGELMPPVVLMENVGRLSYRPNDSYREGFLMATLRGLGYEAEWRVLDCADYGVPQNRDRFVIIARRDGGRIVWPAPTHTAGDSLFLEPWVTMAEALGWEGPLTAEHWRGAGMVERHGTREPRDGTTRPAPAITSGVQRRLLLDTHRGQVEDGSTQTRDPHTAPAPAPAPALTAKAGGQWTLERPSTTIQCDPRVPQPGHHDEENRQMDGSIRLTVEQAARLQDFPDGYRFAGSKTDQFTQIGNAVPRSLARVLALGVSCPT